MAADTNNWQDVAISRLNETLEEMRQYLLRLLSRNTEQEWIFKGRWSNITQQWEMHSNWLRTDYKQEVPCSILNRMWVWKTIIHTNWLWAISLIKQLQCWELEWGGELNGRCWWDLDGCALRGIWAGCMWARVFKKLQVTLSCRYNLFNCDHKKFI